MNRLRVTGGRTKHRYRGVLCYSCKDLPAWQISSPVRGSRFLKEPGESRGSHLRPSTQLKGPRVHAAVDILLHTGRDIKGRHLENFLIVCSTRNSICFYPYLHPNLAFMDHVWLLKVNLHHSFNTLKKFKCSFYNFFWTQWHCCYITYQLSEAELLDVSWTKVWRVFLFEQKWL